MFLRKLIMRVFRPCGTSFTPQSFGMTDAQFFLAVLRACPAGTRLDVGQDEGDQWVRQLKQWSYRKRADQYEADYYRIDGQFTESVEQLIRSNPANLSVLHHITVTDQAGRCLLQSMDDFTIITCLDAQIRERLTTSKA